MTRPRGVLLGMVGLILVGLFGLGRFREEEDILAFLPGNEPDVVTFRDVARRFGALRVALIGVTPPSGTPLFSAQMLSRIERLSTDLRNIEGVDRVVSLSTMTDLDPSSGSVEIRPLVPSPPPSDEVSLQRIRRRALALPQVRGNIVSADGESALVLVFLTEGANTRRVASRAQEAARATLVGCGLYFGGAPFAGQAIYDDTQVDVRRLTPLAMALFFAVVLLSFRDWLAVVLTVGTVGVAGILVTGGMGLFGEPFTVVTAMLPVILFAAGSQYAIHILGRYYLLRVQAPAREAAQGSLRIAGPPVSIAAAATALGFLSFLVMNVRPMRSFGIACAFGIFFCWLLSLTVLPAVVTAWPRPYERHAQLAWVEDRLFALWTWVQKRRVAVLIGAALLLLASAGAASQVVVRMEPRAFFRPGSEPARAQAFLDERFGGSQFLLVSLQGDVAHPLALRELRRLGNYARGLPGVTQVQSILDALRLVGEAMNPGGGLPVNAAQAGNLLVFIEGEPSVRALLQDKRVGALVHVRVLGEPRPVLAGLERYLRQRERPLAPHTLDEISEEAGWLLKADKERAGEVRAALSQILGRAAADPAASLTATERAALSLSALGEALAGPDGEGLSSGQRDGIRARAESLRDVAGRAGPGGWEGGAFGAPPAGVSQDGLDVLLGAARDRFDNAVRGAAVNKALGELLAAARATPGEEGRAALRALLADVLQPVPPCSDAGPACAPLLKGKVSGEPVLDRGFSRAVEQNQWASLRVALVAVFLVLLLTLRSVGSAVICMLPAGLALSVVFGLLGATHRPIDIGTSLVGSIVTGSGADFAMHYMWYLRRNPPKDVVRNIGPVILVTALLLGAGLGVLGLSHSPPLQLFGLLAAGGMVLSAVFTFFLVPALLRKVRSERRDFG